VEARDPAAGGGNNGWRGSRWQCRRWPRWGPPMAAAASLVMLGLLGRRCNNVFMVVLGGDSATTGMQLDVDGFRRLE